MEGKGLVIRLTAKIRLAKTNVGEDAMKEGGELDGTAAASNIDCT